MSVRDDLTRLLGLLQTAPMTAAKQWAQRTRELAKDKKTWDKAAITAATEVFPAEFKSTQYRYGSQSVEELVNAIEKSPDRKK